MKVADNRIAKVLDKMNNKKDDGIDNFSMKVNKSSSSKKQSRDFLSGILNTYSPVEVET